ncbi:MAG: ATPase [Bacteroidetes bacterium]|nr:ATPase [Bacteroidota bacterium]
MSASPYDYSKVFAYLEKKGKEDFGNHFALHSSDLPLIRKLLAYFLKDEFTCEQENISLKKGIMLSGTIGCGKTTLMYLMKYFNDSSQQIYLVKPCRDVSFEFIQHGYEVILRYSKQSFYRNGTNCIPKHICFDDLGIENNLKYYGNECNVMAEILLSRYDCFISSHLITHLTTNLSASEIETIYGNRVRSRMREMFNLLAFDKDVKDKRK